MAKTKLYTFYMSPYGGPAKHVHGQNGISGSYMDAVFELRAHEASDIRYKTMQFRCLCLYYIGDR